MDLIKSHVKVKCFPRSGWNSTYKSCLKLFYVYSLKFISKKEFSCQNNIMQKAFWKTSFLVQYQRKTKYFKQNDISVIISPSKEINLKREINEISID